jgi:Tfp pilus assembly protein PilF
LGNTLKELNRLDESEASYRQAIALKPDFAEAYYNLGNTLKELGRLDEAESSLRQAIALKPDYAEVHSNLGVMLKALGRLNEAEASCRQAIALKPDSAEAHNNLGVTLPELGRLSEAEASFRQAIALKPDFADAYWNLHGIQKTIQSAENCIDKCLEVDENHVKARLTKAALRFYQGETSDFNNLMQSELKQHPFMRSFAWVFSLPNLPSLYFDKWHFFDAIVKQSITAKPFYEFGVWRASSFKYLIKVFKKGYGFDTFTGLPEDWDTGSRIEKKGTYTSDGNVPKIQGGEFVVGKFEDTLPVFFSESRPIASVINFDADLYSSTICALNFSKSVMDKDTILIFDELIITESWEQDEFKALNEFCSINHYSYEVIAISFFTKQVAVKLIGI